MASRLLENRAAVVTGAGRGIGRAIALRLAGAGASVLVLDVDADSAQRVAAEIKTGGASAGWLRADVAALADIRSAVDRAVAGFGGIDVWVNNAGIMRPSTFLETTEADWDAIFAVNTRGLFFCTQMVARHMMERRTGRIINIASVAGKNPGTFPAYCASKAAVISITRSAALALAPYGITVNAVCPGVVDTDMWRVVVDGGLARLRGQAPGEPMAVAAAQNPLGRVALPEDIASAVAFLASADAAYVTGQTLNVDGGSRMD